MATDDLNAPLGLDDAPRRRLPLTGIAVGLFLLLAAVIGGWVMLVDDPAGGEPIATASIPPALPRADAGIRNTPAEGAGPEAGALVEATPDGAIEEPEGGEVVIREAGSDLAQQSTASVPLDELLERTRDGLIPKIGADGTRPIEAYARPVGALAAAGTSRVAIVVGGLGISAVGTESAINRLPPDVTLAFAPYGSDLGRVSASARQAGHEILLQIPLEPFDYPNNDPGPHTLRVNVGRTENIDRLHWLMARIDAYVGVVGYMGARFTAEPAALGPVLEEIGSRGLLYLDDGASARSRAREIAGDRVPFAKADLVLDAVTTPADIDDRLLQLEQLAMERGYAIGMASAFPVSIDRIAEWAKTAADRGVILVPLTALVGAGRS